MHTPSLRAGLTAADVAAVEAITRSSGFFSAREVEVAAEVARESIQRPELNYWFLVAEDQNGICGYACFGPTDMTDSTFDLYWIAVGETQRGRGIGSLLLARVEQDVAAAGGTQLVVETAGRDQYAPTRAFYEAHGYQLAARLADYYARGDDKIIYVKRFDSS